MTSRILALRRGVTSVLIGRRKYSFDRPQCDPHMNELPIPCRPWDSAYKSKQRAYGALLILGLASSIFSFYMMIVTNTLDLNCMAPDVPAEPTPLQEIEGCD